MINELKVLYTDLKGLVIYDKKIIFQHKYNRKGVEAGIGVVVDGTLEDRGNYAFAEFENVKTVLPDAYLTLEFFENRGVPSKIEKGSYNGYIFIRETYMNRVYIRAYREDGTVGLYESKEIKNANYRGPNSYFNRICGVVEVWEDITDEVVSKLVESVKSMVCTETIRSEVITESLKGLKGSKISVLGSGVIIADGKFESLIIWSKEKEVKMAWFGRKFDKKGFEFIDATNMI